MSIQQASKISDERWARAFQEAVTYEQFVSTAEVNVEKLQANYDHYHLSEQELAFFAGLPEPVDVLVLAHDWCGDVVANLPLFAKIEHLTGKLRLHILPRDPDNLDIAAAYLHKDGTNHIPTYVFFNEAREEQGVFLERPDAITELLQSWIGEFWDLHPEWEGRGKPYSELTDDVKRAFFGYLKEQRAGSREHEKIAIIEIIRFILK